MMGRLVSVIMPCYNSERFLEEAARSALTQSYQDVELVVVDDGSTDSSVAILKRLKGDFGERLLVLEQEQQGQFPARNRGIRSARGEYIAFLDSDDYWDVEFVAKLVAAMADNADVAYCGWRNVGDVPGGNDRPFIPARYELQDPVKSFLQNCPWPIHAVILRKEIMDNLGGFAAHSVTAMDYDLWLRLLAVTRSFVLVPEVLAYYRFHGNTQMSSIKWRQVLSAWNSRRAFVRNNPAAVSHLDPNVIEDLVDGFLRSNAYAAYWRRDLQSAMHLFRQMLKSGTWKVRDLKYAIPALAPEAVYKYLVQTADGK